MPSSFDDVRLDVEIERGSIGGPIFKTAHVRLNSGHARRAQLWSQPLGRWDISYGLRQLDDDAAFDGMTKIINFFYARRGRLRTFRFKDWFDYQVTDEQFGTGDAATTVFQLTKDYVDTGSFSFTKNITKPRQSPTPPVIKVDAVTQTEGVDYTIDYTTGLVTFTTAPANAAVLTWTGEFDKHTGFESDELEVDMAIFHAGSIPSVIIREERE